MNLQRRDRTKEEKTEEGRSGREKHLLEKVTLYTLTLNNSDLMVDFIKYIL